jgi:hypothetical protein
MHKWYGYKNASLKATYEFGAGKYYTDFELSVKSSPPLTEGNDLASYIVTFKNTGAVASRCRVVLFVRPVAVDPAAPKPLPVKQIVTFGGTPVLAPGEFFSESFSVSPHALSMTDSLGKRSIYSGKYEIQFSLGNGIVQTVQLAVAKTAVLDQMPLPREP